MGGLIDVSHGFAVGLGVLLATDPAAYYGSFETGPETGKQRGGAFDATHRCSG